MTYPALVLEEQLAAEVQMSAVFQPVPGVIVSTLALLKREEITLRAFAVLVMVLVKAYADGARTPEHAVHGFVVISYEPFGRVHPVETFEPQSSRTFTWTLFAAELPDL